MHKKITKKQMIVCICILLFIAFLLWRNFSKQQPKLPYPKTYQIILQHCDEPMDSKQKEKDIKNLQSLLQQTQQKLKESQELSKQLPDLRDKRDETERAMYDAMDKALYVGKYICKVNTCQANPDDPNYAAFVNATNQLVKVKKELAKAKEAFADATKKASQVNQYKQLLEEMKTTLKKLTHA